MSDERAHKYFELWQKEQKRREELERVLQAELEFKYQIAAENVDLTAHVARLEERNQTLYQTNHQLLQEVRFYRRAAEGKE